ncbi:MORN repeat-containing protein [Paenibacillus uliginis N3/975]|uniref:MORN repeat-containing protein n=1 Tax=Paenibacillus uliginis N3/975 TaxID=1313296 RepID=A0A1X7GW94_9BACL|nr:hypothetical protein [Paenibacillus uliginis]SMF75744.1 MORN repeat-containing protein [Paenibacillus uliginis N3/975]
MKKIAALSLSLALSASLTATSLVLASPSAEAASSKEWIHISERTTYYGDVENGQPDGRGTINWGDGKQYSGDFKNGKRSGNGKYINQYIKEGEQHKVVYSGSWSGDKMEGTGTLTHKVTLADGTVRWNQIQTGTFKNNQLQSGYDVIHALADPDYSFSYKNGTESLTILGSNVNILESWKTGRMFSAQYKNGSVNKEYSFFPGDTKAEQRKHEAVLKYFQSIQSKVTPHLQQFQKMSKQVPLK